MSYLHLTRTRTRERTPEYDTLFPRRLLRRDSNKRQRIITLSDEEDDGHDDYPYSTNYKSGKLSRALTIRNQPSQLERYNIWSDKRDKHSDDDDDEERRRSYERRRIYKYSSHRHSHSDDDCKTDPDDREFKLKVKATFSKPKSSSSSPHRHHHHESTHLWPTDLFRSREKWSDEAWETRERSTSRDRRRRDSFWDDADEKDEESESWSRYRKIKRTKTEEWRPLSGWRRERIIYGP